MATTTVIMVATKAAIGDDQGRHHGDDQGRHNRRIMYRAATEAG